SSAPSPIRTTYLSPRLVHPHGVPHRPVDPADPHRRAVSEPFHTTRGSLSARQPGGSHGRLSPLHDNFVMKCAAGPTMPDAGARVQPLSVELPRRPPARARVRA